MDVSVMTVMFQLILLVLVGLLAAILLLRQQSEKSQQQKQSNEGVKPLEETDGRISGAETCRRTTNESSDVYLKVEGKVVRKDRLGQLLLLLEDQFPELRGEVKPIRGRVQNNTVLVGIGQPGKCTWDS